MLRRVMTIGAVLLAVNAVAAEGNAVRVMSFNIRYDNPADGPNAWPHRKDWVAEIVAANADVVGMQEVVKNQLDDLKTRLTGFEFHGVGRDDGKEAGEFVPIGWRTERFTAVEKGAFWLSETPDEPGSKSWDSSLPRVTTWVRLKDASTGGTLLVVNTHFDHRGETARQESAKLIRSWIGEHAKDSSVVLMGDFNTRADSPAYQSLTEGDGPTLRDARLAVASPEGPESTWNGFLAIVPGQRIDFVFTGDGIEAKSFRTIDETREGRFPSDHLPIVATIEVGAAKK